MNDLSRNSLRERSKIDRASREMFLKILQQLCDLDKTGHPHAGDLGRDAFAARAVYEMRSLEARDFNIFTAMDKFRHHELECPKHLRVQASPRLDFSEAKTYADLACTLFRAMIEAGAPYIPGASEAITGRSPGSTE